VLYGPREDFKDLDVIGPILSLLDFDKATLRPLFGSLR
jgi:hypothetical protein